MSCAYCFQRPPYFVSNPSLCATCVDSNNRANRGFSSAYQEWFSGAMDAVYEGRPLSLIGAWTTRSAEARALGAGACDVCDQVTKQGSLCGSRTCRTLDAMRWRASLLRPRDTDCLREIRGLDRESIFVSSVIRCFVLKQGGAQMPQFFKRYKG